MSEQSRVAEPDSRIQETQFSQPEGLSGQEKGSNDRNAAQIPTYATVKEKPSAKVARSSSKAPRVLGPDLLRGFLMILQSIDHAAVSAGAWGHGQASESEGDGQIVDTWLSPVAWTARTLTHLCAPGFFFLLGMGVVYFGRSRSKLGWSNIAILRHFFVRALALALVSEVLGLFVTPGKIVILNTVLLALAFNYFLSGVLWLLMSGTESGLTTLLSSSVFVSKRTSGENRPLLANEAASKSSTSSPNHALAAYISFHIHNGFLVILSILTMWLNIWMSPNKGHCSLASYSPDTPITPIMHLGMQSQSGLGAGFDFWFYNVWTPLVMSGFPPLAWISFSMIGLLYARIVLYHPARPAYITNTTNLCVGLSLLLLFAATRLLHIGNLSEDCLQMPEHRDLPADANQYLASFRSFFYITKYPPSPAFLFFTMGLNFVALAGFGALPEKVGRRLPGLLVFGQSALFFYLVHIFLYAGLGALAKLLFGQEIPGKEDPLNGGPAIGIGEGVPFWIMWAVGLVVLHPVCRWYGNFKATKGPDSVWRFF